MKRAEIVFRADGDSKIGLGHIYRCLALAEILSEKYTCAFAIRNSSESIAGLIKKAEHSFLPLPESMRHAQEPGYLISKMATAQYIVLDGYSFTESYTQAFSEAGKKVILIDDLCTNDRFADVIINHAPGIKPEFYKHTKASLYLGPAYALLREPFRSSKPVAREGGTKKLLIAFGGADPENFTCKLINLVSFNTSSMQISVITGSAFQHQDELRKITTSASHIQSLSDLTAREMYAEILSADAAIVPSSTLLFEVLAVGTPALTGYYVGNQKMIYEGFLASGAILGLGNFRRLSKQQLNAGLDELSNKDIKDRMKLAMEGYFDGKIRERILGIMESLESA